MKYYPDVNIELVEQPKECPVPVWERPKFPRIAHPYPVSATEKGILKQLWSLNRAWEFAKKAVKVNMMVIRLRPDSSFSGDSRCRTIHR